MFRKNLIGLLHDRPLTVTQLSKMVDEPPKDVASDLEHLLKSLKHTEYTAVIDPARCKKCGFEFSNTKLTKPSKCPECHSTWLAEATIEIKLNPAEEPGS